MMDKEAVLMDYVKNEIMRNRNAQIDKDEDLLAAGILDSLSILNLVAFIEESFGIRIPDEDVVYDNFKSINALAMYLQQYN